MERHTLAHTLLTLDEAEWPVSYSNCTYKIKSSHILESGREMPHRN